MLDVNKMFCLKNVLYYIRKLNINNHYNKQVHYTVN